MLTSARSDSHRAVLFLENEANGAEAGAARPKAPRGAWCDAGRAHAPSVPLAFSHPLLRSPPGVWDGGGDCPQGWASSGKQPSWPCP